MALPCHVLLEKSGPVGIDDGTSSWSKTDLQLVVAGRVASCNVLTNAYTGKTTLRIHRNDLGLEPQAAKCLLLKVFRISRQTMAQAECDAGEALFDLEHVIRKLFNVTDAPHVMRALASVA